jgi:ABC-type branched-subunit amino acid transport system substrate-binding protein
VQRKSMRLGAALVAILVAVSACSSNKRGSGNGGPTSTAPAATGSSAAPAAAAAAGKFGTLDSPCGKGDAKGATEQGVTDTSISIGYGDDRGFAQSPGLNKEIGDAVKAMIKWCNDQGGINGRTIKGDFYDAAITQVNTAMQQACKADFMLVGEGWAGDEGAEQTRVGCKLPAVPGYAVGPDFANAPMMYQALPNPDDYQVASIFYQMAKQFPDAVGGFAIANSNLPAIQATSAKVAATVKTVGYKVLDCGVTTSYTGEPSYVPFAQKFKQCGAKIIYLPAPGPQTNNLITAIHQVGLDPIYVMQANGYTADFAQWNTAGFGNKVFVMSAFEPLENAAAVPAVQQYVDAVKAVGGKTALLGMQGASSFLLWATAAKACGADLTRQCVINNLAKEHEWTGGGLNAPTDPGANLPSKCGLVLKLDGTKWVQDFPSKAGKFDCNDGYAVKTPEATWGTTLNADRIATKFLTGDIIKPQS